MMMNKQKQMLCYELCSVSTLFWVRCPPIVFTTEGSNDSLL